ncbi:unnamed protein product, partial [Rotaria sp. Silwood1]
YDLIQVRCIPEGKIKPIEFYEQANLDTQVLSNIRRVHFEKPTPAAFLLPIISNLIEYYSNELHEKHHLPSPLCLILSPTRELALQTEHEARKFAYQTPVIPCSVVGGHDTVRA